MIVGVPFVEVQGKILMDSYVKGTIFHSLIKSLIKKESYDKAS